MNTKNTTVTNQGDMTAAIAAFALAFSSACEGFVAAGRIYAESIAAYGDLARDAFNEAIPNISPSVWRRLESIGNGTLDQRLFHAASQGARSLRRLPAPLQSECLDRGVDVLLSDGDSLRVTVDHLRRDQVRQVFAADHVRTLSEQKAFIAVAAPVSSSAVNQFTVSGSHVTVRGACKLSRQDLIRFLAEMG